MCGIVGTANLAGRQPVREGDIRQMLSMIRHRGPDQFGIYLDDHAGLGSARLSIIDLDGGQQPISNEDGTLWIVFNGEVFNYVELRPELESRGHRFATHTDTEVILHLYEEMGPDCLKRLNGQFAIAIWNARDQTLFLARDRLGVRPLFYSVVQGDLIFGSEIKAILASGRIAAEMDPVALDQIFTFWSVLSPRTVFRGIVEIPPGHFLMARRSRISVEPYWQISFPADGECGTSHRDQRDEQQCAEEFRELLVDAARLRLRADVPVGAYLSGGLDSSTIAAIVRNHGGNRLDTFSIAFADPQFDESEYQRRMARFLGTEHQVAFTTHADIGNVFPEVIWHTETPIMRTSPAPMFLLSKLVRKRNFKVVLTGEGADEFLAGYDIFKEAKVRRFWARQPGSKWRSSLFKRLYPDVSGLANSGPAFLAAFFEEGLQDTGSPDYSHAVRWRNNRRTRRFFSEAVTGTLENGTGVSGHSVAVPEAFAGWGPLQKGQFLESSVFLSQYLLSSQGDRVAMANSVEGRFPFLDYRVVEFCNRLPARLKLRGLNEKYLLKTVSRDWLPEEVWSRPKRPYRAPIHASFLNPETVGYYKDLLSPREIERAGFFKPLAVTQLIRKIEARGPVGETDDMALAGIISTQLVHHQFVSQFRLRPTLGAEEDVKVCIQQTKTMAN